MPELKTREIVERGAPIGRAPLQQAKMIEQQVQNAALHVQENAGHGTARQENAPEEYAADRITGSASGVAVGAVYGFDRAGRQGMRDTYANMQAAKAQFQKARQRKMLEHSTHRGNDTAPRVPRQEHLLSDFPTRGGSLPDSPQPSSSRAAQTFRTRAQREKTAMRLKDSARKGKLPPSAKTARAPRSALSVSRSASQTAQKAHAVKQIRAASLRTKAAAQAAAKRVKEVGKASIRAIRRIIAATKALFAALMAGSWIAMLVVVLVCLIGLIAGSGMGIFFAAEDAGGDLAFRETLADLNTEFYDRISEIEATVTHDVSELQSTDGMTAIRWEDVLAVYAAKVSADDTNGMDVVTMDATKKAILRAILWDMNALDYTTRTETSEIEVTVEDEDGNETTETREVTQTVLTITLTRTAPEDAALLYGFSAKQNAQLALLQQPEYSLLWARLLGGFVASGGQIMAPNGPAGTGIFSWPLPVGGTITSQFGHRADPFTDEVSYHSGTDISAPEGTPILAAADGTVTVANATDPWGGSYGYHVILDHGGGLETLYAHCSAICVVPGQTVRQGEVIGYVGRTGRATGDHLHFEVRVNGERADAMGYFAV